MLKLLLAHSFLFSIVHPYIVPSRSHELPFKRISRLHTTLASVDFIRSLESLTDLGSFGNVTSRSIQSQDFEEEVSPLMKDIELLSSLLGEVIKREDETVFKTYKTFCTLARKRADGSIDALGEMVDSANKLSSIETLGVVRAFTETLSLINAAEVHHRTRILRKADKLMETISPLPMREDSMAGTIENILLNGDHNMQDSLKEQIFQKLLRQQVDIVLTSHPTEVNRRTLLRKYRTISELLAQLDREDTTPYERNQVLISLKREIASIWGSDEIRRNKPTPQQEARGGLAILESVLWDAIPSYLRKLDSQCIQSLGKSLPLSYSPIKFSSWMGGDRDGNPNVTPAVTYEVAITQRLLAAKLLLNDIGVLYKELAICRGFSLEMKVLAATVKKSFDQRELYRRVLGHVKQRLTATMQWCDRELSNIGAEYSASAHLSLSNENQVDVDSLDGNNEAFESLLQDADAASIFERMKVISGEPTQAFFDTKELLDILEIIHKSLVDSGFSDVADGNLIDVIRRVSVFGLTLVPLDIREESTKHMNAVDAITRYLGIGSYAQWDEATKISWLNTELLGKRPLFRTRELGRLGFDPQVLTTLRTFETLATLGPGSLGAYVISQARAASDVLAVMLLQKQFGMTAESGKMLRVVPLFETLNDLQNAESICETLFSSANYVAMIKQKQEIMVGYSDSAKDAGRLAASWALYESQENIVRIAEKFGVELTFFHGKGGTVGRGGNPALYRAVLAHPPKTINGKFRVTEQGEMITQNFGSTGIAERTLDIYTAAVLAEQFVVHVSPKGKWRDNMKALSNISCDSYRSLLLKKDFVSYFRSATPELELGSLNIGSRPNKRNPAGGIESMRAIPWQFAWTQTRLHLPAWAGVGDALLADSESSAISVSEADLHEMYREWPFFREIVDLIAMTLSKTDYSISSNYELQLVRNNRLDNERNLIEIGDEIRGKLVQTRKSILRLTGTDDLTTSFRQLQMSMKVRYPFVDPLNVLQAEIMRKLRFPTVENQSEDNRQLLVDSLVVSINGIAQGMKNSG